ncbi:hypothetical protein [Nocardia sp.]|uniref:hypothetical protein n=1 Tax=Nocardia sp. TaxID=1821 RepID=UPI0026261098|nr:hypothetical protein [Nocardia sp.]
MDVQFAACRPVLVCGARLGAIDMPAVLGGQVLPLLPFTASVPVIADSRGTTWTFLVDIASPESSPLLAERNLVEYGVVQRACGQRVLLPVSNSGTGWHWANEPTPGGGRPPAASVLASAARVIASTTGISCAAQPF